MEKKSLLLLLPLRSVVFPLIFITGAAIAGKELSDISSWWSYTATIVNILTVLLLIAAAKHRGQTYAQLINYRKGTTSVRSIVLISLLILSVGMTGMCLAGFICYGVIPYGAPIMIGHAVIDAATVMQIAATSFIPGFYDKMCNM